MSLLDKASIIITPTAYDVGSINAIKPIQTIGSELVTNGDFSNGSTNWSIENTWTISNGLASGNGANGAGAELKQNSILPIGKKYRLTYEIKNYVSGTVKGGSGEANSGNGTYIDFFTSSRTALAFLGSNFYGDITNISVKEVVDGDLDFERATSGSVVGTANRENANGVLEEVAQNVPRIDYLGGAGHWLVEPQATNTATYSNDFTQGTLFNGGGSAGVDDGILTSAQATSPDGTNNAWKFADNNDGNSGTVTLRYFSTSVNSGDYNVVSLFVKKQGNNDWFQLTPGNFDFTSAFANFNISNGTLGTVTSDFTSANIEDYGDGWYRISATFTSTTDLSGAIQFRLAEGDNDVTFTRDGTNGAFIYGIQAESTTNQYSTKPTSYIPTDGSQVTRAKDQFGFDTTLDTSLIDSTEGTFYAEISALQNDRTERAISISDGSNTNTIWFRFRSDNRIQVRILTSLGATTTIDTTTTTTNFFKLAARFKTNDIAFYVNGSLINTNTIHPTFSANTLNKIRGGRGDSGDLFKGKIKCIAVFKEALTDEELTCLTT